jgi:hypothetical protein
VPHCACARASHAVLVSEHVSGCVVVVVSRVVVVVYLVVVEHADACVAMSSSISAPMIIVFVFICSPWPQ